MSGGIVAIIVLIVAVVVALAIFVGVMVGRRSAFLREKFNWFKSNKHPEVGYSNQLQMVDDEE